jgi:hypothetical protein
LSTGTAFTPTATECTQPSTAGYDFSSIPANAVNAKTGFNVTLTCASGYVGIASATACGSNGQDYTVGGCVNTCINPTAAGYVLTGVPANAVKAVNGFNVTGVACDAGYVGTASAAVCTGTSAKYVVSGCVNTCTAPTTAGYVFTGVPANAVTDVSGFNVTGLACDTGYSGTAAASVCSGTSAVYDVTGCSAIVCTRPTTVGYDYSGENAANCLLATGTATTCSASLSCSTGYTGTPVATLCTSAGAYSVTGCTEVTTTTTAPTTAPAGDTTTAAKAAVDAGVHVTANKMGILIAFLALFFIH